MKWIQSNGGPLILVPEARCAQWRGIDEDPATGASHYDIACSVTTNVEVLQVRDVEILVLGDEPLRTAWIPQRNGGILARWVYADSEQSILAVLNENHLDDLLAPTDLTFYAPGPCLLFDSAEPGDDIVGDFLRLSLSLSLKVTTESRARS